jgi:hypothetical protein
MLVVGIVELKLQLICVEEKEKLELQMMTLLSLSP